MNVLENEMIASKSRLDMDAEKRNQQEHQIRNDVVSRRRLPTTIIPSRKTIISKPIPISIEKNRKRDSSSAQQQQLEIKLLFSSYVTIDRIIFDIMLNSLFGVCRTRT